MSSVCPLRRCSKSFIWHLTFEDGNKAKKSLGFPSTKLLDGRSSSLLYTMLMSFWVLCSFLFTGKTVRDTMTVCVCLSYLRDRYSQDKTRHTKGSHEEAIFCLIQQEKQNSRLTGKRETLLKFFFSKGKCVLNKTILTKSLNKTISWRKGTKLYKRSKHLEDGFFLWKEQNENLPPNRQGNLSLNRAKGNLTAGAFFNLALFVTAVSSLFAPFHVKSLSSNKNTATFKNASHNWREKRKKCNHLPRDTSFPWLPRFFFPSSSTTTKETITLLDIPFNSRCKTERKRARDDSFLSFLVFLPFSWTVSSCFYGLTVVTESCCVTLSFLFIRNSFFLCRCLHLSYTLSFSLPETGRGFYFITENPSLHTTLFPEMTRRHNNSTKSFSLYDSIKCCTLREERSLVSKLRKRKRSLVVSAVHTPFPRM